MGKIYQDSQVANRKKIRMKIFFVSAAFSSFVFLSVFKIPTLIERGRRQIYALMTIEDIQWEETGASNLSFMVTRALLLKKSGLATGQELLSVNLENVEKKLRAIPWINTLEIQKRLPS